MLRRVVLATMTMALLGGCVDDITDDAAHDQRFEALWVVEWPPHALYEYTLYRFERDGTLRALESFTLDGGIVDTDEFETGIVSDGSTWCEFGDRWHSRGDAVLVIDGECEDGTDRAIVLELPLDAARNTEGVEVELVEVGGDVSWARPFVFQFRKCLADDVEACRPIG